MPPTCLAREPHRLRILLLLALVLPLSAGRAESPNPPPYYAIRNARLVTVSGAVIEKGTIVVANGLIAAVGVNVPIPPEAWVVEGDGLTVYPGLIDSLTNLGLPPAEEATRPGGPGQPARPVIRGPEDRPATTTWENAADALKLDDKRLEQWRKAGFTAAVSSPEKGIFPGQAALINLGGERASEMVVKTPVALRVNFATAGSLWGFPGSLMGVLSYVKQLFLDADQYSRAWEVYAASPRGLERPAYDRTLEPLRQARAQNWPVLLPAARAQEIDRALRLADELGARPLLYGAHQGYDAAAMLAAKKAPVLVSLKWPEKAKEGDPDAEEPLRELRLRDRAPSTPAALEKAGVKFAFYSDGITSAQDILKNARKAVEAGLPEAAAVRAFTLSAAEIFGVADRLGSLEPGKIANLTVTDGDLLAEKTKVKMVFIDGRKYEAREPGRPTEPPAANMSGQWKISVNTPQGPEERTAELTMAEDGTLSGSVTGPRGTTSITSGWVSGNKFSFTLTFTMGARTLEATYSGTLEGSKISGTVSAGPRTMDFTGARPEKTSGGEETSHE